MQVQIWRDFQNWQLHPTDIGTVDVSNVSKNKQNDRFPLDVYTEPVRETSARPLANGSAFWAGQVENWPGQVEFCIEHIRDIYFWASAPKM